MREDGRRRERARRFCTAGDGNRDERHDREGHRVGRQELRGPHLPLRSVRRASEVARTRPPTERAGVVRVADESFAIAVFERDEPVMSSGATRASRAARHAAVSPHTRSVQRFVSGYQPPASTAMPERSRPRPRVGGARRRTRGRRARCASCACDARRPPPTRSPAARSARGPTRRAGPPSRSRRTTRTPRSRGPSAAVASAALAR